MKIIWLLEEVVAVAFFHGNTVRWKKNGLLINVMMLQIFIYDSLFSSQGELLSTRVLRRRS